MPRINPQIRMFYKFYFCFANLALLIASVAQGAAVKYGNKSAQLAESFAKPMQCIIGSLEQEGYKAREVGCFATRPRNRSAHPTGHACDVDQTARNVTQVNRLGAEVQKSIAQSCQAVSGCIWPNPDCGHFEARSAPYSPAGAGVGGSHYYGEKYASHPVRRR
jgi:hypothetical protein